MYIRIIKGDCLLFIYGQSPLNYPKLRRTQHPPIKAERILMTKNNDFIIKMLSTITNIPIYKCNSKGEVMIQYSTLADNNKLLQSEIRNILIHKTTNMKTPTLHCEWEQVYWGAVHTQQGNEQEYIIAGPLAIEQMSYMKLHNYNKMHKIPTDDEVHPTQYSFIKFNALMAILYNLVTGGQVDMEEILKANKMVEENVETLERDKTFQSVERIDEDITHHTYMEELQLTGYVKNGDQEGVEKMFDSLISKVGKLAKGATNHYRYLAICIITLVTRAAIEGGVTPAAAYALSDIYVDKVDQSNQVAQLYYLMKESAIEFTKQVNESKSNKASSNYINQCKDYILNNYQRKIVLEEVAHSIGLNKNYLSHLFHKKEGITMNEYINKLRVKRAENLLKYSEATLTEISSYVCFHSQSHFGSVFKKYMNMTPQQYRDKYKTSEFISKEMSNKMISNEKHNN